MVLKKNTNSAWCDVLYWVRMSTEGAIQHGGWQSLSQDEAACFAIQAFKIWEK